MADKIIPNTGSEAQAPSTGAESAVENAPEARIVSEKKRTIEVDLEWPVEYDGKTYESVTISRVSGKQVEDYIEALTSDEELSPMPPFVDIPRSVWDALDDDDRYEVDQKSRPFMPRRLLAAAELTPENTENTSD